MNYLFFAFSAATCFAISQLLNKVLSKHSIDNRDSMMFYFMLTTFSFGLVLLPFVSLEIPSFEMIKVMAVAITTFVLGYYCFFAGIHDTDASTSAPLFQLQAGLVGLLAFLFLGERFPPANYFWMALTVLGAVLVSFDEKMTVKSFFNKGILFVLLMQLLHAISNLFVGFALKELSPIQVLFWENMTIGVLCLFFWLFKKPKTSYRFSQISPMFISSFVIGVGVISLFRAFSENLTISSVIGLLSAPLVFVFSFVSSKFAPQFLENHSLKIYTVRGVGLLIILLGAYKIVLG